MYRFSIFAKVATIALFFSTSLVTTHAQAFINGNKLLSECESEIMADMNFCLGYVSGAADANDFDDTCIPEGVTLGQIRDIVKRHLVKQPQYRHMSGSFNVSIALAVAFPCKNDEDS